MRHCHLRSCTPSTRWSHELVHSPSSSSREKDTHKQRTDSPNDTHASTIKIRPQVHAHQRDYRVSFTARSAHKRSAAAHARYHRTGNANKTVYDNATPHHTTPHQFRHNEACLLRVAITLYAERSKPSDPVAAQKKNTIVKVFGWCQPFTSRVSLAVRTAAGTSKTAVEWPPQTFNSS